MGKVNRVLVVDDHPIVRQGLYQLINHEQDLEVCGEAENLREAMKAIAALEPDVVVMDLSFQGVITYDIFQEVKLRHPGLPVLVLSMHDESVHAERVLQAGARGYVMKHEATEKVIIAIHKVMGGEIYLGEKMTGRLLAKLAHGRSNSQDSSMEQLTDRELEVFRLIGQGYGTRKISELLSLSPKTIESHRERIRDKLSISNASELLQYAIQWLHPNTKD